MGPNRMSQRHLQETRDKSLLSFMTGQLISLHDLGHNAKSNYRVPLPCRACISSATWRRKALYHSTEAADTLPVAYVLQGCIIRDKQTLSQVFYKM